MPATPSCPVIVTSVPPRLSRLRGGIEVGPGYRAQCVASFRAAGFEVVSVNSEHEAHEVAALGLDIEIVTVAGSSRPTIGQLLAASRGRGVALAGIVNADCFILPMRDLTQRLHARTRRRLILAERLDVEPDGTPLDTTTGGFDGFFFDPADLPDAVLALGAPDLRLGDVWWDYWFPVAAMAAGLPVANLLQPVLGHLCHPARWDEAAYARNRNVFLKTLLRLSAEPQAHPVLVEAAAPIVAMAEAHNYVFADHLKLWLAGSVDWPRLGLNDGDAGILERHYADLVSRRRETPRPASPGATLNPGQRLAMVSSSAEARRALGAGWSHPEDWGVWSDGPEATMTLVLPGDGPVHLACETMGFLGQHSGQTVTIRAGGRPLAVCRFDSTEQVRRDLVIPRSLIAGSGTVELSFSVVHPQVPAQFWVTTEHRALGFALLAITRSGDSSISASYEPDSLA